ncbi:glycosyltransferase family 2 protein [Aquabacterium sp.]|uniref:glycosyltransferase family 2 protein n=1 Tax=Aquabacterium sp. TaxID=1872578 RepID=UPI003D6D6999
MSSTVMTPPAASVAADLARVTVVLVTFHSAHCAPELGRALADFPHVTVVDNASTDDTLEQFRRHLPKAALLANDRNLGFGAANNRGIWAAGTEFVLLLNPDCVVSAEAVSQLIRCADTYPGAAMIGPQLLGRSGQADISYTWAPNTWSALGPGAEAEACVGFISGACMLIRRDAMLRIQGFDEGFFLYYEDTDLCLRLARQCGELIVAPQALVTHLSRGSSGGSGRFKAEYMRGYHHIQSKFLFNLKHLGEQVSTARRWRYCMTAALEMMVRVLVLDLVRATRVLGRVVGAWRYPDDMRTRQRALSS